MQERTPHLGRSGQHGTLSRSTLKAREALRTLSRAAKPPPGWLRLRRVGAPAYAGVLISPLQPEMIIVFLLLDGEAALRVET